MQVKKKPILVIVGNPPYAGESRNKGEFITNLINDYKFIDGVSLGERNSKWLQDDYVKFIRFAEHKMQSVEEGIVAVITNHGFLDNPTFRGMRASLLKTFNQINIVNLHGNSKKKEVCTDGSKDENVFDIQQGVAISFFIKKKSIDNGVFYQDIWGIREKKFEELSNNSFQSKEIIKIEPRSEQFLLINFDNILGKSYNNYIDLTNIFQIKNVGIVTGNDDLYIDYNITDLSNKIKCNQPSNPEFVSNLQYINNIHYRPFDTRSIYYNAKFIARSREIIMQHMLAGENLGLVFNRNDQGSDYFSHVFVSNNILDGHHNVGLAYLSPLYLYHVSTSDQLKLQLKTTAKTENFTTEFRSHINKLYDHHFSPEEIMGYIYGVLHSPLYREKYLQFLKMDFPRIPFTKDKKQFLKLSILGWELIQIHLMKGSIKVDLGSYEVSGSDIVEKPLYDAAAKRLYINQTQYFDNVPEEVWNFYIGGYQVIDKYLKYRKGRKLSLDEIVNIENVINILAFTIEQMKKIDEAYKQIDGEFK